MASFPAHKISAPMAISRSSFMAAAFALLTFVAARRTDRHRSRSNRRYTLGVIPITSVSLNAMSSARISFMFFFYVLVILT